MGISDGCACCAALKMVYLWLLQERELCSSARLLPVHYLALKDIMLRDCGQNGSMTRADVSAGV